MNNELDVGAPIANFSSKVVALPSENPVTLNNTKTTSDGNSNGDSGSGVVLIIAIVIGIVVTGAITAFVFKMIQKKKAVY